MGAIETPTRLSLTVEQYEAMHDAGVFPDEARVELIDGVIYEMAPPGSPHHAVVMRLTQFFCTRLATRATISPQGPLKLPPDSYPQPDLQLLAPREDFYEAGTPQSGDVLLLIEVSASTLRFDRKVKLPMYARRGVVEVWIIDVARKRIEVSTGLAEGGYGNRRVVEQGGVILPTAFPDFPVRWGDAFG